MTRNQPHDDPATPILNAVRRHPDAATAVCICADDLVKHWRRPHEAPSFSDVAEHMSRLATLLARLAIAVDALKAANDYLTEAGPVAEAAQTERVQGGTKRIEVQTERDDDSAEFAVDANLGKLRLP